MEEELKIGMRVSYKGHNGTITSISKPRCKCKGKNIYHIKIDEPSAMDTIQVLDRYRKDIQIIDIEPNQDIPNFMFDN